jgi:predicted dehydrogenase
MTDVEDYTVHDATHANLEFASGVTANITSACMVGAGGRVGLDIYTKRKTLKLTSGSLEVIEPGRTETLQSTNNPYLDEDRIFLAAVESGDGSAIRSSYADALKTLKVTLAANRSIAERRAVEIE